MGERPGVVWARESVEFYLNRTSIGYVTITGGTCESKARDITLTQAFKVYEEGRYVQYRTMADDRTTRTS